MSVKSGIKNYTKIVTKLDRIYKKAPRTVLDRTLSDVRTRVPAWVGAEVAKQYGIKKGEVGDGKTSKLRIDGNKMPEVRLIYSGRMLTPVHFNMTPKAPAPDGGSYTLKATIIKGKRSTLGKVKKLTKKQRAALGKNFRGEGTMTSDHSPIMLMHTGNKKISGGVNYIPFQRTHPGSKGKPRLEVIKTLSVPDMIDSERVRPNIQKAIDEKLGKRLDHHMKLLNK